MKNKLKKHSIFKILSVILLIVVVLSYFVKGREDSISYIALGDVIINYMQSFYYFFDTALFIMMVGGFYALLNKTKGYRKLIDNVSKKFSKKGKEFVIGVTILFALVSSLSGLNMILFVFVPMFVSIILLLGYDKLVAMSATVGAIIVGFIGGIFTTVRGQSGVSTFEKMVGLDGNFDNIVVRIILFVVVTLLLVLYIISYIKNSSKKKNSYDLNNKDSLFMDVKDKTGKVVKVNYEDAKVWPLVVIYAILFVLLVLGFFPWNSLFKVNVFNKFHTWLIGLSIGKYAVFPNLISSNITAFGEWVSLGTYMMPILLIIIFSLIIKFVYKIKFDSALDAFLIGVKKMLPSAMLAILAYTILICSYNNGFIETIINNASDKFGDNVIIHSLITLLGSITNVDLYYTNAGVFSKIVSVLSDGANLKVFAIAFQSLFGLVSIVAPTSIILIVGLSYLDIPYTTWLKYIWRFLLELVIVIFVTLILITLI